MVIAGSLGKAGAAIMAAKGALRTGAGLVSVATPNSLVPIIQQSLFEAMCIPAAESIDGTIGIGAETELLQAAAKMTACAIGPGTLDSCRDGADGRNLVPRLTVPVVIDADGLNALAGSLDVLKQARGARHHDAPSRGNGQAAGNSDGCECSRTGSASPRLLPGSTR